MRLRLHKWPKLLSSLPVTKTGIHRLLWHWLFHINSAHVSSPLLCIVKRLKSTRTVHAGSSTRCLESNRYTTHKHNTNFSLSWKKPQVPSLDLLIMTCHAVELILFSSCRHAAAPGSNIILQSFLTFTVSCIHSCYGAAQSTGLTTYYANNKSVSMPRLCLSSFGRVFKAGATRTLRRVSYFTLVIFKWSVMTDNEEDVQELLNWPYCL